MWLLSKFFSRLRIPRLTGSSVSQARELKFSQLNLWSLIVFSLLLAHATVSGQPGPAAVGFVQEERFLSEVIGGCPDFSSYYQESLNFNNFEEATQLWTSLEAELVELMPSCLRSSEFFAFLGAAQLNSFQNSRAIESLERSLLLKPDNGAARIDYAQALYNSGQLFPALEINEGLLTGGGLPVGLLEELENRDELWRSDTRKNSFYLDFSGGYDDNLNGAPNASEINLTLSGEEVALSLGDAFRSTSGGYSNLRVANRFGMSAPDYQHGWSNEIRTRLSGDQSSDLLRFDSRYSFLKPARARSWQIDGALTHLLFGGSSLFSAAQLKGQYQLNLTGPCSPAVELTGQRQYFRQQFLLDGIEGKLAGRVQCDLGPGRGGYSSLSMEFGLLRNYALQAARPGGNREGWQASVQWQSGRFFAQASQTQLDDRLGYSSVLARGAQRWVKSSQLVLQFKQPLRISEIDTVWFINFFHQNQRSNINLFAARDTSLEFGLGFVF